VDGLRLAVEQRRLVEIKLSHRLFVQAQVVDKHIYALIAVDESMIASNPNRSSSVPETIRQKNLIKKNISKESNLVFRISSLCRENAFNKIEVIFQILPPWQVARQLFGQLSGFWKRSCSKPNVPDYGPN
jgi:hypothetical protein